MKHRIVVIGAGLAGLAAARSPRVGGRAATMMENGFAIDIGAGFLANFYALVPSGCCTS